MNPELCRIRAGTNAVQVSWGATESSELPYIWLRDNDPADLHPTTLERTFDLTGVNLAIQPQQVILRDGMLEIRWPDRAGVSRYSADWLYRHRPGHRRDDAAQVPVQNWTAATLEQIPRFASRDCSSQHAVLYSALRAAKSIGLVVFDGLADSRQAGLDLGDLIGFKRRSNFGTTFDVVSRPDANNLAYTAVTLPLHTDLPNQELVPGYQFLHCLRNDAQGGESLFADGHSICAEFKATQPAFFECLRTVAVPFRFHDKNCDIRCRRPLISQGADGQLRLLVLNAHIADVPDMPAGELYEFYAAYQALLRLARQRRFRLEYSLQPGEMIMFDNHRVLHGRGSFDPDSGTRRLSGFYIDHNEIDSRLRILQRQEA